jgi:hypothetical protein
MERIDDGKDGLTVLGNEGEGSEGNELSFDSKRN